jgi:hypothetical protein
VEFQSSIREELGLLTLKEAAEALGYTVDKRGYCRQLERICSKTYCDKKGFKHLPHYFGGKKLLVNKIDLLNWIQQFKQ